MSITLEQAEKAINAAIAKANDVNSIGDLVPSMIHPIDGVDRTTTCLSVQKD